MIKNKTVLKYIKNKQIQWLDKMRTDKRASIHLEIILSFVIFIGFLIFLFAIFPLNMAERSYVSLDSAERGIMNFTSVTLDYFTVTLKEIPKKCFHFKSDLVSSVIVKNASDSRIEAKSEDAGSMKQIIINDIGRFYKIYSYSEFQESSFEGQCQELETGEYEIGLERQLEVVSYMRIMELNSSYGPNYAKLLELFKMPKSNNFGFVLREINGEEIIKAERKMYGDILVRNVPIQIVYPDGDFKYAILTIETW